MSNAFRHPINRVERGLRAAYCALMPALGMHRFPILAQGGRFWVETVDAVEGHIGWDAIWEPMQLERLAAVARTRHFHAFYDIGANIGFYAVLAVLKNLADEVVAFEPDPDNRARLTANIEANGLGNILRVHPYALGERAGRAVLTQGPDYNRGESWLDHPDQPAGADTLEVEERRFDDEFALAGKNLLIKMDVEGYEFRTLAGMKRTLRENACYLQVELYSERIAELKDLFARLGYRYLDTIEIDHYFTNIPDAM
jgi:FkbM family methyltransferase